MFSQSSYDAPVVVGRLSLNKKKAKRNLQRIAESSRDTFPKQEAVAAVSMARMSIPAVTSTISMAPETRAAPEPKMKLETKPKRWADFSDDEDDDFFLPVPIMSNATQVVSKAITPKTEAIVPKTEPVEPMTEAIVPTIEAIETTTAAAAKRKVHRGGRSAAKREEQRLRMLAKISPKGCFTIVPDAVLAQIFDYVELSAVAAVAATGRAASAAIWANGGFWAHVSCSGVSCRDSFRRWLFGLDGDWSAAFHAYSATANGTETLREAEYLIGGLLATEKRVAPVFLDAVLCATRRVTEKWDEAEALFGAIVQKASRRIEVFGNEGCEALAEAGALMKERALLARLSADDEWDDFDHFPEPEVPEVEKEDEEEDEEVEPAPVTPAVLDLDFAQSFLDLL
jgi:hypothetical protein